MPEAHFLKGRAIGESFSAKNLRKRLSGKCPKSISLRASNREKFFDKKLEETAFGKMPEAHFLKGEQSGKVFRQKFAWCRVFGNFIKPQKITEYEKIKYKNQNLRAGRCVGKVGSVVQR